MIAKIPEDIWSLIKKQRVIVLKIPHCPDDEVEPLIEESDSLSHDMDALYVLKDLLERRTSIEDSVTATA